MGHGLVHGILSQAGRQGRSRAVAKSSMMDYILQLQQTAIAALARKKGEKPTPVIHIDTAANNEATTSTYSSNALGFPVSNKKRKVCIGALDNQPSIEVSMSRVQKDVNFSNNTSLEMAIADLFHCKNMSDLIANSFRFALVLR